MNESIEKSAAHRLKTFILYGILYDAVLNLYRPFTVSYLERLGGDARLMFILNSLPALLSALALLPSLFLFRRLGSERTASAFLFILSRLFLLSFVLVPLLPPSLRPLGFVVLFSLMSMPDAAAQSGMQSYLGQVFNADERGRAIALRSQYGVPVVLVLTVTTGLVLRYLPSGRADRLLLYQGLFVLAFLLAVAELAMFLRLKPDRGRTHAQAERARGANISLPALRKLFGNKKFILFLGASLTFHFGWQLGWPLFSVWHIKYLGADEAWLGLFSVVSSATMFFSYRFWNRVRRTIGIELALVACTLGQALNPVFIALADQLYLQAIISVFTGFFTAGVVSLFLAALLDSTPDDGNRIFYFAAYNTCIYLSQAVSQELGRHIYTLVGIRDAILFDSGLRFIGAGAFGLRAYLLSPRRRLPPRI